MNYYNEWDAGAAAWLRELIKAGHIPQGIVDERSITEVTPSDLAGFTQCHFFCGIGGWSRALQLAGVPATVPLWTGSPPCQPFSVAGTGSGKSDVRHLAPAFLELIAECRPQLIFGEQVAAAVTKDQWADALLLELAEEGYASGFAVLPACSVGAAHKRDRLFFGAALGKSGNERQESGARRSLDANEEAGRSYDVRSSRSGSAGSMADTDDARPQGRGGVPECADQQPAGASGVAGSMAYGNDDRQQPSCGRGCGSESPGARDNAWRNGTYNAADPHHSFWSDADWLGCRDGKFRPVESGTFPLAHGIPARVGRLRGYGNAVVPQVAAEFITAFLK